MKHLAIAALLLIPLAALAQTTTAHDEHADHAMPQTTMTAAPQPAPATSGAIRLPDTSRGGFDDEASNVSSPIDAAACSNPPAIRTDSCNSPWASSQPSSRIRA